MTDAGYRVLSAKNGREALDIAANYPDELHLVLTDMVMPGMDGRKPARLLRVDRPRTKVIFMSGYSDDSETGYAGPGPGDNLIAKPFDHASLLKTLRASPDDPR